MTDSERWARVEALVDAAADLAPADRPAFLDRECRTPDGRPDAALREEAEALLALDADASRFFDAAADRLASVAAQAGETPAPERVGPWRLVREIGRGGMGTVHLAERADGRFEQTAALKLVRPGLADGLADRFRAERQILARLDHPAIARLIDGGQADDGRPFLVMEHVDGEPITAYCDRRRLAVNERIALFESVCEAVQFAHSRLVVHRDLKPSNVLVAETEAGPRVKLLDFGIAKLLDDGDDASVTTAGERMMTPEYAAPEQVRGEATTTATDVYALGVLLYELLTGSRPTAGARGRHAVEAAILNTEPARPSDAVTVSAPTGGRVPPDPAGPDAAPGDTAALRATTADRLRRRLRGDLDRIVLKALAKEPERRYVSAAALADDLKRHLAGLPVEARPASARYRMATFVRRHRLPVALAALALVAVVGGAGAALWQARTARAERDRAEDVTDFLVDVFQSPDPFGDDDGARDVTVAEALGRGVARVRRDFAGRPETQRVLLTAIADVYGHLDRADDEAPLRDEILALARRIHGERSAETAEALGRKAALLNRQGEYEEAGALFTQALALTRATHAAGDPAVARAEARTASFLLEEGDYEAADSLIVPAIATYRRTGDAAELAAALDVRGGIFRRLERPDEAWPLSAESVRIYRRLYGDRNANTAMSTGHLALTASIQERFGIADTLYRRALAGITATLGPAHAETIQMRSLWATSVGESGDHARAEALHRENLRVETARYGPVHRNVGATVQNLATVVNAQERYDEGAALNRRAFEIFRATMDPGDPTVAFPLISLAWVDLKRGALAEAEATAREALPLLRVALPADHPAVLAVTESLGEAVARQRRFAEAEAVLLPVYRARQATGPEAAKKVSEVLADLYTAWDRPADAARYRPAP